MILFFIRLRTTTGRKLLPMTADLTFDFQEMVTQACQEYSWLRERMMFIAVSENFCASKDRPVALHMYGNARLRALFNSENTVRTHLNRLVHTGKDTMQEFLNTPITFDGQTTVYALIHNTNRTFVPTLTDEKSIGMFHMFFHELGHALCAHGLSADLDKNLKECCADAYAALRLLHAYGDRALGYVARLAVSRTASFLVSGETSHLTLPALLEVIKWYIENPTAIQNCNPTELVGFADDIAVRSYYTPSVQERLQALYLPVKAKTGKELDADALCDLMTSSADKELLDPGLVILAALSDPQGFRHHGQYFSWGEDTRRARQKVVAAQDSNGQLTQLVNCLRLSPSGRTQRPQLMGF